MNRLIRSEIRKVVTTRWFKITMAVTAVLAIISPVITTLSAKSGEDIASTDFIHKILSISAGSMMVMLACGISVMAGEFRHGTSTPTFLITPRRSTVVVAKLVTVFGIGAVVGAVTFGFALATAVPALSHEGVHHLAGDTAQMWFGAALGTAMYGAIGVALGAITRNTVVAIIGAVTWVYFIEAGLLVAAVPSIGKWLPTGAGIALTHTGNGQDLLAPAVAAALLAVWMVMFSGLAVRRMQRRDV